MAIGSQSETPMAEILLDCEQHRIDLRSITHGSRLSQSVADHGSVDDPLAWTTALEAVADTSDFAGVVAQDAHLIIRASEVGMVCLDDAGNSLHPILWAHDSCSKDDASWCRTKFDDAWWTNEVGLVPEARHLVTKMSWLHRSEPDLWSRIRRICSLEDFVVRYLVGDDMSGPIWSRPELVTVFGVWSPRSELYSSAVLGLIDSQRDWTGVLPDVRPTQTQRGMWRSRSLLG